MRSSNRFINQNGFYFVMTSKTEGQQSANKKIRKEERKVIDQLINLKESLDSMSKDLDMALDYYRLRSGGSWRDTDKETKKSLRPEQQNKKYVHAKTRENLISEIGYIINDLFEYPKERMYGNRSEILNVDFGVLQEFVDKNEEQD